MPATPALRRWRGQETLWGFVATSLAPGSVRELSQVNNRENDTGGHPKSSFRSEHAHTPQKLW